MHCTGSPSPTPLHCKRQKLNKGEAGSPNVQLTKQTVKQHGPFVLPNTSCPHTVIEYNQPQLYRIVHPSHNHRKFAHVHILFCLALFQYSVCAFSLVLDLENTFGLQFNGFTIFMLQFQLLKLQNPLPKGIWLQLSVKKDCFLLQYSYGFFLYVLVHHSFQFSKVKCS